MQIIVYYDANKTVRRLIANALEKRQFHVLTPDSIEAAIDAIKTEPSPAALIFDLSRSPSDYACLQDEIPRLFPHPERCILTTTHPSALAPYLPESVESCFFKHVVERPFKKEEFLEFIQSVVSCRDSGKILETPDDSPNPDAEKNSEISQNPDAEKNSEISPNPDAEKDSEISPNPDVEKNPDDSQDLDAEKDSEIFPNPDAEKDSEISPNLDAEKNSGGSQEANDGADFSHQPIPEGEAQKKDFAESDSDAINSNEEYSKNEDLAPISPTNLAEPESKDDVLSTSSPSAQTPLAASSERIVTRQEMRMSRIGKSREPKEESRIQAREAYRMIRRESPQVLHTRREIEGENADERRPNAAWQSRQRRDTRWEMPNVRLETREKSPTPLNPSEERIVDSFDALPTPPNLDTDDTGDALEDGNTMLVTNVAQALNAVSSPADFRAIQPLLPAFYTPSRPAIPSASATRWDPSMPLTPLKPAFLSPQVPNAPLPAFRNAFTDAPRLASPTLPTPNSESYPGASTPAANEISALPFDERTAFQPLWFVRLLCESLLTRSRMTITVPEENRTHVLFIEAARAFWFETFTQGVIPDVETYLNETPEIEDYRESILNHVRANRCALSQAFKALNLEENAARLCRKQIETGIRDFFTRFQHCRFEVFDGIPTPFASLIRMRPCKFIALPQIVFDQIRQNEESIIQPEAFASVRFVMRAYRSPLNHNIRLTNDELELLALIQTPKTIQEIKQLRKKHVSDILYRLWLFQFVDLCA